LAWADWSGGYDPHGNAGHYTDCVGMGSWSLCSNARCDEGNGLIDMDTIDGQGHTGYLSITPDVKYLKLYIPLPVLRFKACPPPPAAPQP